MGAFVAFGILSPIFVHAQVPTILHVSSGIQPDRSALVQTKGGLPTSAEITQLANGAAGMPANATLSGLSWSAMPVIDPTLRSSVVGIPANWTLGIYALRLTNVSGTGSAVRINAPDPIWVQGDQGETASPGGYLRVGGACLQMPGKTATLALVSGGTVVASIPASDAINDHLGIAYGATFPLPGGLTTGTYEVWLHNGCGGVNGWTQWTAFITSRVSTFTVAVPTAWPATTVYYAAQSGTPDQRMAACFTAVASGGVVVLPDGITSGFTVEWSVPDKVLIRSTTTGIQARPTWTADPVTANTPLLRGKILSSSPLTRAAFNLTDVVVVASPTYYFHALAKEFCTTPTVWLRSGATVPRPLDIDMAELGPGAFRLRAARNHRIIEPVGEAAQGVFGREDCRFVEVIGGTLHWTGYDIYLNGGTWAWWIDGVARILDGDPTTNHWAAVANPNPGTGVALFASTNSFCRAVLFARCTDTRTNSFTWQTSDHGTTAGFTGDGGSGINFGTVTQAGSVLTFGQANFAGSYNGNGAFARILSGTGAGDERYVVSATPGATTVTLESAFTDLDGTSIIAINPTHGDVFMIANDLLCRPLIQSYGMTHPMTVRGNIHGIAPGTTAFVLQQGIERSSSHVPAGSFDVAGIDAAYGPVLVRFQSQVLGTAPGSIAGTLRDAGGAYRTDFATRSLPTPVVDAIAEAISGNAAAVLGSDVPNYQGVRLRRISGTVTPASLPSGVTLLSNTTHLTSGGSVPAPSVPSITTQPANQSVLVGVGVTFSVAASGSPASTYKWRKNGTVILGATNASYTIAATTASDAGNYSVVVTNSAGSVTSNNAVLIVIVAPTNAVITITVQ